jgi:hypothetical protein
LKLSRAEVFVGLLHGQEGVADGAGGNVRHGKAPRAGPIPWAVHARPATFSSSRECIDIRRGMA